VLFEIFSSSMINLGCFVGKIKKILASF